MDDTHGVTSSPRNASTSSSQEQILRLLSYNIQVGITTRHYRQYITNSWKHVLPYPERMETLRSIGQFIAAFDIVGLQELDTGSLRSGFVDQAEYLAQVAMFPHWYSRTNRRIGRFAQHALGLLGRYRAHRIVEHRLPSAIPGRGALEVHYGEHTYPSWRPAQAFDHILMSPALEVREAKVFPVAYSDHLPVGLELVLPPEVRLDDAPTELECVVE
ncbi:MAG: hypothetical protein P8014_12675 [Acidihalobacter sp.]|uniref:endonuclease/exonuclease/phosphatase family protein n=1 Tax=Acidihalobacter sp. TaxID=1872108 RepID=UPI00307F7409